MLKFFRKNNVIVSNENQQVYRRIKFTDYEMRVTINAIDSQRLKPPRLKSPIPQEKKIQLMSFPRRLAVLTFPLRLTRKTLPLFQTLINNF